MAERFIRCRLCGLPHPADVAVCPVRGEPVVPSTMLAPESRPELLDDEEAPTQPSVALVRPATGAAPRVPRAPAPRVMTAPSPPVTAERKVPSVPPPPPVEATVRPGLRPTGGGSMLVGALLAGRYRVSGVIAAGGMGVVYDAVQVNLGRRVAVKVLHPKYAQDTVALARFQQEAELVGSFGHANIVEVFDMGWLDDGTPFLVMERLDGETLTARLARERPLRVGLAVSIARQTLAALMATHARGVLHRDLKPDNLFLAKRAGPTPRVKVLDFGVAKGFGPQEELDEKQKKLTRAGFVMGTPAYMSPEQARGDMVLDARTDLYAVGMLLYETLTGRLPYNARTPAALLGEIAKAPMVPLRKLRAEVSDDLEAIVMRSLAPNREHRWHDAMTMHRALQSLGISEEVESRPVLPAPFAAGGDAGDLSKPPTRDEIEAARRSVLDPALWRARDKGES
ncbi:MAG: serine/threonine protein kinase [Myxococcales bacterium]|nr:serine/threonine protein kinase [Myxococcales bacterium]